MLNFLHVSQPQPQFFARCGINFYWKRWINLIAGSDLFTIHQHQFRPFSEFLLFLFHSSLGFLKNSELVYSENPLAQQAGCCSPRVLSQGHTTTTSSWCRMRNWNSTNNIRNIKNKPWNCLCFTDTSWQQLIWACTTCCYCSKHRVLVYYLMKCSPNNTEDTQGLLRLLAGTG